MMAIPIRTPERYRQLAEAAHRSAELAEVPEVKRTLALQAANFLALANEAEAAKQPRDREPQRTQWS